jgi:hypothetical protein
VVPGKDLVLKTWKLVKGESTITINLYINYSGAWPKSVIQLEDWKPGGPRAASEEVSGQYDKMPGEFHAETNHNFSFHVYFQNLADGDEKFREQLKESLKKLVTGQGGQGDVRDLRPKRDLPTVDCITCSNTNPREGEKVTVTIPVETGVYYDFYIEGKGLKHIHDYENKNKKARVRCLDFIAMAGDEEKPSTQLVVLALHEKKLLVNSKPFEIKVKNKKFLQGGPGGTVFSKRVPPGRRRQKHKKEENMSAKKKLFALMAGINQYAGPVNNLSGSVNDMESFKLYVEDIYRGSMDLCIETLKNSDATRENIISGFRNHLGKARQDDVVLFYYSGHGSRQFSAPEFKEFFPEGLDETLVCHNSRLPGQQDLADKELAVLLAELSVHHPHIALVMDCCHAGGLDRTADDFKMDQARSTARKDTIRTLESYLDGYYTRNSLNIPFSPHVLLAACKREQLAWEVSGQGIFTGTLLEVLEKQGTSISYADAFIRCRYAIRKLAYNQTPQFESYGGFNAYTAFLDGKAIGNSPRCTVFLDGDNTWKMNLGALHGIPTDPKKSTELTVYKKDTPHEIAGHAKTTAVNAQVSRLELDFTPNTSSLYKAEIKYLPISPLAVYLEGDETGKKQLQNALEYFPNIVFVETRKEARYQISSRDNKYLLFHIDSGQLVEGIEEYSEASAQYILWDAEHIRRWEHNLEIQNTATNFDINRDADFKLVEIQEDGSEREYSQEDITLDFKKVNGQWRSIPVKIKVKNNKDYPLHFALFHFSRQFGVKVLANEPEPKNNDWVTLWGAMGNKSINLPDDIDEAVDTFKLIVSTERVDSFLLEQVNLQLGKILPEPGERDLKDVDTTVTDDWFTKIFRVKTVRQQAQLSRENISLSNGNITFQGHESFKANISTYPAISYIRPKDPVSIIPRVFARDFQFLDFSPQENKPLNVMVLELSHIENEETLKDHPLEMWINIPVKENEIVLPVTFDGENILPAGSSRRDKKGYSLIQITYIPAVKDKSRNGNSKSLSLCFLKLRREECDFFESKRGREDLNVKKVV